MIACFRVRCAGAVVFESLPKEQPKKLPLADVLVNFPSGEQRRKGRDEHDASRENLEFSVTHDVLKNGGRVFPAPQARQHTFSDAEHDDEDAEAKRFVECGDDQRMRMKSISNAQGSPDNNEFAQDQCFDKAEPELDVSYVVLVKDKPSIIRERRKKNGEISRNEKISLHLCDELLPEV